MSFCIFNQQRRLADGTQNTPTSPMLKRCASFIIPQGLKEKVRNCY